MVARKDMTNEQYEAKFLREGVESRVRRLRVLADQIEGQAMTALASAEAGQGRYSAVGEVFVRELAWGIANVSVEQLLFAGTSADVYATEERLKKSEGQQ